MFERFSFEDSIFLTRRRAMGFLAGAVVLGGVAARSSSLAQPTWPSVDSWLQDRAERLVAHRGAGDVVPEHTLPAYREALNWGARAIEVSVVMSSDGVLYCLHDVTLDRTTTATGPVDKLSAAELDSVRVSIPRLGPRWQGDQRPFLPRLENVLDEIGNRAVLCVEAKNDGAFPALDAMLEHRNMKDSVYFKISSESGRLRQAKSLDYRVFGYIGNLSQATESKIAHLANRLDRQRDILVLPISQGAERLADAALTSAVATGIPVWGFPVHRRSEWEWLRRHGADGAVTSSIGYVSGSAGRKTTPGWAAGFLEPGVMTRDPASNRFSLTWLEDGVVQFKLQGEQHFVTLGHFAPLEAYAGSYRLEFDVRVDSPPTDQSSNVSIAFGHESDEYYEHQLGLSSGYHTILRMDGTLELREHVAGSREGRLLAPVARSPAPGVAQWIPLRLEVTREGISWQRLDSTASVKVRNGAYRGNYVHIGRSATNGIVSVRRVKISSME